MADVEDVLEHFGVKGMHWGVRKDRKAGGTNSKGPQLVLTKKLKTGDSISIYQAPPHPIARLIKKFHPSYDIESFKNFTFKNADGANVGEGSFNRTNKDELYLNWIGVKTKYRGKGYASAAMQGVVKYARNEGIKKLTLEVPGNSPDAQHIYEKLGFKIDGKMMGEKDDIWGGLYPMSYNIASAKHAEADAAQWESDFADEFGQFLIDNFGTKGGVVSQMDTPEDILAHFGVKGMKWGVHRKSKVPASKDAQVALDIRAKAKKGKPRALTNAELQLAINRMNLEQQFKRLAVNERPPVQRWVASTLLEIGKREVQTAIAKKVTSTIAKKVATGGVA